MPRCCCRSSRCRAASWPRVVLHRPRRRLPARGGVRASSPRSDSDIQQIVLHHTYHILRASFQATNRTKRVAYSGLQPYRSITFAGAAHSSTTSEERPPSPTGVTLCLFSEWKSSASPTCGQGQGQVGGSEGRVGPGKGRWARRVARSGFDSDEAIVAPPWGA